MAKAVAADASDYYYSGLVSLLQALNGASADCYSWATVKLYYSTFYFVRAYMGMQGHCLFYIPPAKTPHGISATPGASATKLAGQTHEAALSWFTRCFPSHRLLSQTVPHVSLSGDYKDVPPLYWIMERRNEVNYKRPRFTDPAATVYFQHAINFGLHQAINLYLADSSLKYVFDPDHAILSYPLEVFKATAALFAGANATAISLDERRLLTRLCHGKGHLPAIYRLVVDTTKIK